MKSNFEVQIYAPENLSEDWYVYIYDNTERKIIKKIYKGINRKTTTYEGRMINASAVKKVIEKELKSGYNPKSSGLPQIKKENFNISDSYKLAYDHITSLERARSTLNQYRTHLNYFTEALRVLGWSNYPLQDFEPFHILQVLEKIREIFGSGNDAFNKDLKLSRRFFRVLIEKFIIKINPTAGIVNKEHRTEEKRLLTDEELTIVINHFKFVCPSYILFMKMCNLIGIRPEECRQITCKMVNMDSRFFELPYSITKNRKKGRVFIPDDIYNDLLKLDLKNADWFLFGTKYLNSRNIHNYFIPAPNQLPKNKSNVLWKQEIKDKLGIDSDMYWLKSKGVNNKLKNGMSMEDIKYVLRHSDTDITEIYATEVNEITQMKVRDKYGTMK